MGTGTKIKEMRKVKKITLDELAKSTLERRKVTSQD